MDRKQHKLNKNNSLKSVNVDGYEGLSLKSTTRELPYNDITRIINENEQFDKERNASSRYRLVTTINPLFSNSLFNVTGERSWSTFNEPLMRDRSYPRNGASGSDEEDFTYLESINYHLKDENGWLGYYDPEITSTNRFLFNDMKPGREELNIITKNGTNWDISFTYPADMLSNELTEDGLDIVDIKTVNVGGKVMTAFGCPYNHNLTKRDTVTLKNSGVDGTYEVLRVGLDNGDFKKNYFVLDIPKESVVLKNTKFAKTINGKECSYYFRLFKKLKTIKGNEVSSDDYDLFPLAFSKNIFGDPMVQLVTKNDLDVDGLVDNLGRPLSEFYLSYFKKPEGEFSNISSGLLLNNIDGVDVNNIIPDIRRIHNGGEEPFKSNQPLNEEVKSSDEYFIGDLVEYNHSDLAETVLAEVHHRFNTINRESGGQIKVVQSENEDGEPVIILFSALIDKELDDGLDSGGGGGFNYNDVFLSRSNVKEDVCDGETHLYYIDTLYFKTATVISITKDGSLRAAPGYYSDGNIVRFWDGSYLAPHTDCQVTGGGSDGEQSGGGEVGETTNLNLGKRQEGYFYKPFHRIKIREFSSYVETGDGDTINIPSYATKESDGKYKWRDLMKIGFNQANEEANYPFLNGSHHLHINSLLTLKRQDPFGEYGLGSTGTMKDVLGNKNNDNNKINRAGDVC